MTHAPQVIVCHSCRRYTAMPALEVPFAPCLFICARCGGRGEISDATDAPAGYILEARLTERREFLAPKRRWKHTR